MTPALHALTTGPTDELGRSMTPPPIDDVAADLTADLAATDGMTP